MSAYWSNFVARAFERAVDEHRPRDQATMRAAALELRARGLTPRDISAALRLSEAAVLALLLEGTT